MCDLTGMDIANASLLDEATATEAVGLSQRLDRLIQKKYLFQEIAILRQLIIKTRTNPFGLELIIGDEKELKIKNIICGVLSYPDLQVR